MARFVLEGEWSGYRSSQQKIVHREIVTDLQLVAWVQKTHSIQYDDGTCLLLSVRPVKPNERVKAINGYGSLIRDCFCNNVCSVCALVQSRQAKKEEGK